jgi:hypothetical protein
MWSLLMRLKVVKLSASKKVVVNVERYPVDNYAIIEFLTKDQAIISIGADKTDWLGYKLKANS